MKFKWTSINLFLIKFLISLLIIGAVYGLFIYHNQTDLAKESIQNELINLKDVLAKPQNNFIHHIFIFSVIMLLSLIIIGLPVVLFYLFYEGISYGFLLASLFEFKGMQGLFYGLIFGLINKLFIFVALIYLLLFSFHYTKRIIKAIKNKDFKVSEYVTNQIIKNIFVITIILIIDVLIYFFGNKILTYFLFLLFTNN